MDSEPGAADPLENSYKINFQLTIYSAWILYIIINKFRRMQHFKAEELDDEGMNANMRPQMGGKN